MFQTVDDYIASIEFSLINSDFYIISWSSLCQNIDTDSFKLWSYGKSVCHKAQYNQRLEFLKIVSIQFDSIFKKAKHFLLTPIAMLLETLYASYNIKLFFT